MQGFFLGLSTGTACLAACAPALVPYLLGEGRGLRPSSLILCQFLSGRLCGYLLFAAGAWAANRYILGHAAGYEAFIGVTYIALAAALAAYGLKTHAAPCAARSLAGAAPGWLQKRPALLPLFFGLATGLNLCPPFLLALATASELATLGQSLLFFFTFFLGTAIYLVPLPLLGAGRLPALRTIGRLAAALTAVYYLYTGIVITAGGIARL